MVHEKNSEDETTHKQAKPSNKEKHDGQQNQPGIRKDSYRWTKILTESKVVKRNKVFRWPNKQQTNRLCKDRHLRRQNETKHLYTQHWRHEF